MVGREELYRLVWAEPMIKVAARFDVSGSYLARVCEAMNVPRPPRGYWTKLTVGKAPPQRPLPEARPGDPLHWSREGGPRPAPRPRFAAPPRTSTQVRIPRDRTHGLVRGAKEHFLNSRSADEETYVKPYKKLLVDVTASKAALDKALEFANDLFNGLEAAGHRVVIAPAGETLSRAEIDEREVPRKERNVYYHRGTWSPHRPTIVYVGTVPYTVELLCL